MRWNDFHTPQRVGPWKRPQCSEQTPVTDLGPRPDVLIIRVPARSSPCSLLQGAGRKLLTRASERNRAEKEASNQCWTFSLKDASSSARGTSDQLQRDEGTKGSGAVLDGVGWFWGSRLGPRSGLYEVRNPEPNAGSRRMDKCLEMFRAFGQIPVRMR